MAALSVVIGLHTHTHTHTHTYRVDLQSEEFPAHLEPYLHERTAHFIHEFTSFASSPYDMIAYDQNVAYNWPASHPESVSRETGEATQGECMP